MRMKDPPLGLGRLTRLRQPMRSPRTLLRSTISLAFELYPLRTFPDSRVGKPNFDALLFAHGASNSPRTA
eukprot:1886540-Rhodomonas_salina.1